MKFFLKVALSVACLLSCFCTSARADYITSGAQYSCDAKKNLFDLLPYEQTSEGNSKIRPGYKVLPEGRSIVVCQLDGRKLLIDFQVIPPQDRGECIGDGDIIVNRMRMDRIVLTDQTDFDFDCVGTPTIVKINITGRDGSIIIQKCMATDNTIWDPVNSPISCKTKTFREDGRIDSK